MKALNNNSSIVKLDNIDRNILTQDFSWSAADISNVIVDKRLTGEVIWPLQADRLEHIKASTHKGTIAKTIRS